MLGTEFVLSALESEGVGHVFMVPGGLIDPFLPALCERAGVTPVVAAQEGGAAYMADGYARARGGLGACLAIGGPGVTNMVTPAAAARSDGSPLLIVSGEVPTEWEGRGGFQDASLAALNDLGVLAPLCVASLAVENPHLLNHHLRAGLAAMLAGRQGPAHLTLPLDVQQAEIKARWEPMQAAWRWRGLDQEAMGRAWELLGPADAAPPHKVAVLAGAGVEKADAAGQLLQAAERFGLPVATTLRAKGVFPESHPLSLGVFGYAGHRPAIDLLLGGEVEVLLVLGSGLCQRDTMFWSRRMMPARGFVQVDIDPTVPGRTWPARAPVTGDCGAFLAALLADADRRAPDLEAGAAARREWVQQVQAAGPRLYDAENQEAESMPLHPARVVAELRRAMPAETVLVVDSGAHRAFCGHYWLAERPRSYLSATNLGPMGWAIPAGVGAKAALPDKPVVVVTGDGCMHMHGMEIQTAARYGLAVIFVVINNAALANVWLRARRYGDGPAGLTALPRHDWAGVARGLGLQAATVERPEELAPAFAQALATGGPYLVDVHCAKEAATPVTPYGQAKSKWVDED